MIMLMMIAMMMVMIIGSDAGDDGVCDSYVGYDEEGDDDNNNDDGRCGYGAGYDIDFV